MTRCLGLLRNPVPLARTLLMLLMDAWRFLHLCLRPSPALAVEHLFLRQQLALYQERQIKPRRPTQATRIVLAWARLLVRLAPGIGHCATGDVDPLASSGVPMVLAVDIATWTSTDSCGAASAHPSNGL